MIWENSSHIFFDIIADFPDNVAELPSAGQQQPEDGLPGLGPHVWEVQQQRSHVLQTLLAARFACQNLQVISLLAEHFFGILFFFLHKVFKYYRVDNTFF